MSFSWKWMLPEIKQDKDVTVFSTFSCGGGSTMGYKRAGFKVIGNCEIDPVINDIYITNNKPKYNYCEDLRVFNERNDLPEELYNLDILDGSPPCTVFSMMGLREETWGKRKKFREGQAKQTLDDLFFVFLDTVEKLRPKIVIAENVPGIIKGRAKGYVSLVVKRFNEMGYGVQLFALNSAYMNVPQARHRIFFIANKQGFPKLKLNFREDVIRFGEVRSEKGIPLQPGTQSFALLKCAIPSDRNMEDIIKRITGKGGKLYASIIILDEQVPVTITSSGTFYRFFDRTMCSDRDFIAMQTFPQDYNFKGRNVQYVCGMSVPPNMMANVAMEVYRQWLK